MQEIAASVLPELKQLEQFFHRPPEDVAPLQFESLIAPEFWEVGASGNSYSRDETLGVLKARSTCSGLHDNCWEASDFRCHQLAANLYLLTYSLLQSGKSPYSPHHDLAAYRAQLADCLSSRNPRYRYKPVR